MAFFFLIEDNTTAGLARVAPPWGRILQGVPAEGHFQLTDWHDWKHVVVHRVASHPARTWDSRNASSCVVATPTERGCRATQRVAAQLRSLGAQHCPGRPLIVIDGPDADGSKMAVCESLWSPRACLKGISDSLVRVTGNVPGLQSEVNLKGRRGLCRRLPALPYLAHARTPLAAAPHERPRKVRIAYASASWGHLDAEGHGFIAWRARRQRHSGLKPEGSGSRCDFTHSGAAA